MTNIREEFEKWKSRLDHYQISDYIWFDVWQAAHEAQQKRIDELEKDCIEVGKDYAKAMFRIDELLYQLEILDRVIVNDDKHATEKITALEARCKELEDALDKINTETTCDIASSISNKSLIWQSAK